MAVVTRWRPDPRGGATNIAVLASLAALAMLARLVPLLRGGGLTGLGNYDDGVYYSAGTALVHGLLPYRDYLFLHPPGIVVLLAPFGLAGLTGHDPVGLAAARIVWILLGALNTVLVARILRPVGLLEAAIGAACYATAFPAIYIEWTPLLEGPAQSCVLAAVLLINRAETSGSARAVGPLLAGALLGLSATFKIWGVVGAATVLAWCLARRRWRMAGQLAAGMAAAVIVICLPFFVAAPARMWQMVVVDQLGRNRAAASVTSRLADVAGLGLHGAFASVSAALVLALALVALVLAVAATVAAARLCVVLTLTLTALLLAGPSWFLHYPGLVTGPLAVGLGAGGGTILRRLYDRRRWAGWTAGVLATAALAYAASPVAGLRLGRHFPAAELATVTATDPTGCVTSDDPAALVALNVLSRDLDNGCSFVADLGGYSYQFAADRGRWTPRARDALWQRTYLGYLRSGQHTLPFRYAQAGALGPATRATIASWTVVARSGRFVLRSPR